MRLGDGARAWFEDRPSANLWLARGVGILLLATAAYTTLEGWRPALKEFALRVCRRIPTIAPAPPSGYKYPVTFEVDLDAPHCVRSLADANERVAVLV